MGRIRPFGIPQLLAQTSDPFLYEVGRETLDGLNMCRYGGTIALIKGQAMVYDNNVMRDSLIELGYQEIIVGAGVLYAPAAYRVPNKRFMIQSTNPADASLVSWRIIN